MGAAENKKLVRDAFEAWGRGDGRAFFKLVADDVRWTVIGHTPISRTYDSKRDFRNALGAMSEHLASELRVVMRDVIADGDKVAVEFESHAAGKNGTAYDQTYCWMLRLADGKVREVVAYLDTELVSKLFS
ncbi:MAG TPA: nuclear transport factor 2 family protein [Candidatus Binataceae bacterium]|jgi:ketosteroid isomerase-like protein|nr:nuclear transport factor 2 family protein [Candidatus Binataceae bacterium]